MFLMGQCGFSGRGVVTTTHFGGGEVGRETEGFFRIYSPLGREETKSQRRNESPSNERIIHQLAIPGPAEDKVVVVQKLDRSDSDTASTLDSDISLFEDLNALL